MNDSFFDRFLKIFLSMAMVLGCLADFDPMVKAQSSAVLPLQPILLKGMSFSARNPMDFRFFIDAKEGLDPAGEDLQEESRKLIKYFLTSLTVPETDKWVNLSFYEKDRVIEEHFARTRMGQDLLQQDYVLKQLVAGLISPETESGRRFWDQLQGEFMAAGQMDAVFHKIWIVPGEATVYQKDRGIFIASQHLKVLMEEDLKAAKGFNSQSPESQASDANASDVQFTRVMREMILPLVEKEVNEGERFAPLRQMYSAMILSTWYKRNLKKNVIARFYVNQSRVDGMNEGQAGIIEDIYQQYLNSFRNGVYDVIHEDYDPVSQSMLVRRYFTGGADFAALDDVTRELDLSKAKAKLALDAPGLLAVDGYFSSPANAAMMADSKDFTRDVRYQERGFQGDRLVVSHEHLQKFFPDQEIDSEEPHSGVALVARIGAQVDSLIQSHVYRDIRTKIENHPTLKNKIDFLPEGIFHLKLKVFRDGDDWNNYIQQLSSFGTFRLQVGSLWISASKTRGYLKTYPEKTHESNRVRHILDILGVEDVGVYPVGFMQFREDLTEQETRDLMGLVDRYRDELLGEVEIESLSVIKYSDDRMNSWEVLQDIPLLQRTGFRTEEEKNADSLLSKNLFRLNEISHVEDSDISGELNQILRNINDILDELSDQNFTGVVRQYKNYFKVMRQDDAFGVLERNNFLNELEVAKLFWFIDHWEDVFERGMFRNYHDRGSPYDVYQLVSDNKKRISDQGEQNDLSDAFEFLDLSGDQSSSLEIKVIDTGSEIHFGATMIRDEGGAKIFLLEKSFLESAREGVISRDDFIQKVFVYTFGKGSHQDRRILEYDFVRAYMPDDIQDLPMNVESVFERIVRNMQPYAVRDQILTEQMLYKFKAALWEIGVHMLNGDIRPGAFVRLNKKDPDFGPEHDQDDAKVILFPISGHPFHWGYLETALRAIAQTKASKLAIILAGADERRPDLEATEQFRHDILRKFLEELKLSPLVAYSDISKGTALHGEEQLVNVVHMNRKRRGRVEWINLYGSDHMHWFAPSRQRGSDGRLVPKQINETFEADTIQKISKAVKYLQRLQGFRFSMTFAVKRFIVRYAVLKALMKGLNKVTNAAHLKLPSGKHTFRLLFNIRNYGVGDPMDVERGILSSLKAMNFYSVLRGLNLPDARAGLVHQALSGSVDPKDWTILPVFIEQAIKNQPAYLGYLMGIPDRLRRLSQDTGYEEEERDIEIFRSWIEHSEKAGFPVTIRQLKNYFESEGLTPPMIARVMDRRHSDGQRPLFEVNYVDIVKRKVMNQLDFMERYLKNQKKYGQDEKSYFAEIRFRFDRALDKIAKNIAERRIDPNIKLKVLYRSNDYSVPVDRELRVGFLAASADPIHWTHLLMGLESMAEFGLDKVIFVPAGSDPRKPRLTDDKQRHWLAFRALNIFEPFFTYSDLALDSDLDGETNVFRFMNLNPAQKMHVFNIYGSDHYRRRVFKNGEWHKDTVLKLEQNLAAARKRYKENPDVRYTFEQLERDIRGGLFWMNRKTHKMSLIINWRPGHKGAKRINPDGIKIHFIDTNSSDSSSRIRQGNISGLPYLVYALAVKMSIYGFGKNEDKAMLDLSQRPAQRQMKSEGYGGIDFNESHLNLEVAGETHVVDDAAMLDEMQNVDWSGLVPVIQSIKPVIQVVDF